jgi:LuxR family maltose regulon positive regulatory protein
VAAHNLGNAYSFLGETQAASAAFAQAVSEGRCAGNHFLAFSAIVSWGQLQRLQGQWRRAELMYREGLDWATAHRAQPLDGLVRVGLGLIAWDRWELALARQHLETGIKLCQRTGAYTLEAMASGALARLAEQEGQREEAQNWLDKTLALAHSLHYTEAAGVADLVEAQCHMARRDCKALGRWLARWQPADQPSLDLRARAALVVAQARLALGDPHGALADLARVQELAGPVGWTQRLVEGWVLEAQAHEALGERRQALVKLGDALDLSWSEGFLRPFAQAGEPLRYLMEDLVTDDAPPEKQAFIEAVWAALDHPREAPPAALLLVEPLTAREMEVLRLLPTELTTAEIADQLVISYHTARTHLKNIYGKLDAHSRHHAVSRAKELRLL